jgi:hypothetical protein
MNPAIYLSNDMIILYDPIHKETVQIDRNDTFISDEYRTHTNIKKVKEDTCKSYGLLYFEKGVFFVKSEVWNRKIPFGTDVFYGTEQKSTKNFSKYICHKYTIKYTPNFAYLYDNSMSYPQVIYFLYINGYYYSVSTYISEDDYNPRNVKTSKFIREIDDIKAIEIQNGKELYIERFYNKKICIENDRKNFLKSFEHALKKYYKQSCYVYCESLIPLHVFDIKPFIPIQGSNNFKKKSYKNDMKIKFEQQ